MLNLHLIASDSFGDKTFLESISTKKIQAECKVANFDEKSWKFDVLQGAE